MRNYVIVLIGFMLVVACRVNPPAGPLKVSGQTMGTTYNITYIDSPSVNYNTQIDSVLLALNQNMSTYIPHSAISQFNSLTNTDSLFEVDADFEQVMRASLFVYSNTQGYFDPTVMPLVNFWGFGTNKTPPNITEVPDSILTNVGFNKVYFTTIPDEISGNERHYLRKAALGLQLDFSAIAKGFGVDKVAEFLEKKGVANYMVEIGGEMRIKGLNADNENWKIGIDKPSDDLKARKVKAILNLSDRSIATSGNYRNYYEKDGKKYVHTINPKTGMAEMNNLLSVTVVSQYCMLADAFATGFMAMGFEEANKIVEDADGLDAYFIYVDEKGEIATKYSSGLKNKMIEMKN